VYNNNNNDNNKQQQQKQQQIYFVPRKNANNISNYILKDINLHFKVGC